SGWIVLLCRHQATFGERRRERNLERQWYRKRQEHLPKECPRGFTRGFVLPSYTTLPSRRKVFSGFQRPYFRPAFHLSLRPALCRRKPCQFALLPFHGV